MPRQFRGQFSRYNEGMQEPLENNPVGPPPVQDAPSQAEQVAAPPPEGPPPGRNRGRFQPGDPRINLKGRPRGSKAGPADADRAPQTGPLMLLALPVAEVAGWLSGGDVPGVANLPADCQVVGCRLDAARGAFVFVIRSNEFPRIAKGALIPELKPVRAPADRARSEDRLMLLFLPARVLAACVSPRGNRLCAHKRPWVDNLPDHFEIVGCRLDAARGGLTFTIRSPAFSPIARGAPIPEFAPKWYGLQWS